jgi:diaminohydroxyphosphoribosylaminopyrimidine deaminase/5-amino-6-(5-phosphoribosylamino)uracil reductase
LTDESYIKLAIEIAKKGKGKVSPNPLVGAVLVKDDKIIGAGYHEAYGGNHAEINAINNAACCVEGSTLYVNLEPCSHFGNTPPCADAIIQNKIKKVVIGTLDVNPLVCGKGIKKLKEAGVEVKVGMLEQECSDLNKFFFKFITKKMPYVTLKIAQTLDGKIADSSGNSKWITSLPSRRYVHNLRNEYDCVLVGSSTVRCDDPSLTVRFIEGRNPKRVILDTNLKLSLDLKIFKENKDENLFIITSKKSQEKEQKLNKLYDRGVKVIFIKEDKEGNLNLKCAVNELSKLSITSVLVEGGRKVFSSFLRENLFDEVIYFISPRILGSGLPAAEKLNLNSIKDALKLSVNSVEKVGDDIMVELSKQ